MKGHFGRFEIALISFYLVTMCHSLANAALTGPVWPAPGGTTFSASGASGSSGGLTFSYSGFDNSQYSALYWGLWEGVNIGASLNGNTIEGNEIMTFSGFAGDTATWLGESSWSYYQGSALITAPISTRFTLTVDPMDFVDAATLGKSSLGVLAPVTNDFTANLLFEANFLGTWRPVNDGFNAYHTIAGMSTSVNFAGGFYYEKQEPVPEPTTMILFGTGLAGLAAVRRRKKA